MKASFPRPHPNAGNALLIEASVYRDPSAAGTDDDIRAALARGIERSVRDSAFGADPYVVIDLAAGRP